MSLAGPAECAAASGETRQGCRIRDYGVTGFLAFQQKRAAGPEMYRGGRHGIHRRSTMLQAKESVQAMHTVCLAGICFRKQVKLMR